MSWFQNFWAHLHTVRHHRKLVRQHCFAVGLYRQGLLHDLSKYSPIEFFAGVRYFQGNRSPNDAQRKAVGYSASWLHHKGRNRHHLEYWIDYSAHGKHRMEGMEMPVPYVVEMFCDRMAASKTYRKGDYRDADPFDYYQRSKDHYLIHPNTQKLLEQMLLWLRDEGEEAAFLHIKNEILKPWKAQKHT